MGDLHYITPLQGPFQIDVHSISRKNRDSLPKRGYHGGLMGDLHYITPLQDPVQIDMHSISREP